MRILLAHNSTYYPAHGGGDRSNRLLVEALAARGHVCRVIARVAGYGPEEHEKLLRELQARSVAIESSDGGVVRSALNGVAIHTITSSPNLRAYFTEQIAIFDPDVILVSTDDPAQVLLEAALKATRARVVYLARATLAVPFGPDCAFESPEKTEVLRQTDGVVGVSQYVADYIRRWSGIEAAHVPISLMEPGPFPDLGRFDNEFVTLVNPCAVKGISIFLALAERMPDIAFAAVPTWGTNASDLDALRRHPNVRILDPVDRIDDLLARTRVLLVPSLWAEARSRVIVEAMLRGVPVMASDVGGIPEAKMGVDYLLPVRPIVRYQPSLDEQMVPVAQVPEQDVDPWESALRRLVSDRANYEALSRESRRAALAYADWLSIEPFERFLEEVIARPRKPRSRPVPTQPQQTDSALDKLSPEKRALLALRLRKRSAAPQAVDPSDWFPAPRRETSPRFRLFCFPNAGGGAAVFRTWSERLPETIELRAARLPGRESRIGEPPITRMQPLIDTIAQAIQPLLDLPCVFFGHSMGAGVAFELTRQLRREGHPLPVALLVAGARAPQLRTEGPTGSDPSDAELLADLKRLDGIPKVVLENQELLSLLLPALRADIALYRHYVYTAEPPLNLPIRAYCGREDPNLEPQHLEAWRSQTTAGFCTRQFPGGHFFLHDPDSGFDAALLQDLKELLGCE
ncbi:MAG: thioesterase domain-containing protein [Bryobacteraceae bacterium]